MKRYFFIILQLILFVTNTHAQRLRIHFKGRENLGIYKMGFAVDSMGMPLPGVLIVHSSPKAERTDSVFTDIDGEFPMINGHYGDTVKFFIEKQQVGVLLLESYVSSFSSKDVSVTIYLSPYNQRYFSFHLFEYYSAPVNNCSYRPEKRNFKTTSFPIPLPKGYSQWEINEGLVKCKTQGDVYEKLKKVTLQAGFKEMSFFKLDNGFAMVLQIEQISEDGTPDEKNRFSGNYYNNLRFVDFFIPRRGFFREIAIVVTDDPLSISAENPSKTRQTLVFNNKANFFSDGSPFLKKMDGKYTSDFKCIGIVYEFQADKPNTHIFKANESCRISAFEHLQKSKILSFLID